MRRRGILPWLICGAMLLPDGVFAENPLVPIGQLSSQRNNQYRNRDAANRARNLGRDSIGRGMRNMRHGRAHHHPPEVQTGALQVVEGILGLLASAMANKLADKSDVNGDNLDQLPSGTDGGASQASAGNGAGGAGAVSGADSTGASVKGGKLSAEDLANPDVKSALSLLKDEFGYTQEELLKKLEGGADPKAILEGAPKNAMTAEELAAAAKAARKDNGTATGETSSLTLAASASPSNSAPAAGAAASPGAAAASAAADAPAQPGRGGLRDALSRSLSGKGEEDDPELSPEVRAALAAREAEERARDKVMKPAEEMDLFEVIHLKYKERENNLRWGEPLRTAETGRL